MLKTYARVIFKCINLMLIPCSDLRRQLELSINKAQNTEEMKVQLVLDDFTSSCFKCRLEFLLS